MKKRIGIFVKYLIITTLLFCSNNADVQSFNSYVPFVSNTEAGEKISTPEDASMLYEFDKQMNEAKLEQAKKLLNAIGPELKLL